MTNLFIFNPEQKDAAGSLLHKLEKGTTYLLNLGNDIFIDEFRKKCDLIQYRDVLEDSDYSQIGMDSLNLSKSWYVSDELNELNISGLSFGRYIDYEMNRVFTTICRHIQFLNRLNPDRIYCVDDGSLTTNTAKIYSKQQKIPIFCVEPRYSYRKYEWQTKFSESSDPLVKSFLKIISNLKNKYKKDLDKSVFVIPDRHTNALIDTILESTDLTIISPSSVSKHPSNKQIVVESYDYFTRTTRLYNTKKRYRSFLKKVSNPHSDLDYKGINLWEVVQPVLSQTVKDSYDQFHSHTLHCQKIIQKYNPIAAVVSQDQVGLPKIAVMSANQFGIESYSIAHGIPGFIHSGYPDVNADNFVVWGKAMGEKWKKYVGVNNIICAGCRNLDVLRKNSHISNIGVGNKHKILYADRPYVNYLAFDEPMDQSLALKKACAVFQKMSTVDFWIRFHPSTEHYENVSIKHKILSVYNSGNIHLDNSKDLGNTLGDFCAVITTGSTVGIEAIAMHVPLIIFDPFRYDSCDYEKNEAGSIVYTSDQLLAEITKITSDNDYRRSVIEKGDSFIRNYLHYFGDEKEGEIILNHIIKTTMIGIK